MVLYLVRLFAYVYLEYQFEGLRHLLPSHPTQSMLQIYYNLEKQTAEEEEVEECDKLLAVFPGSSMILSWKAQALFHLKGKLLIPFCTRNPDYCADFQQSEALFDELLVKDPFRIEGVDMYSAILYVLRKKTKLSKLARRFSGMSRDRPEVCCVIGKSDA